MLESISFRIATLIMEKIELCEQTGSEIDRYDIKNIIDREFEREFSCIYNDTDSLYFNQHIFMSKKRQKMFKKLLKKRYGLKLKSKVVKK